MSIPDDWQPPPCRHGVRAEVGMEFMYFDRGTYVEAVPARNTLFYDCPTPMECVKEQRELADRV